MTRSTARCKRHRRPLHGQRQRPRRRDPVHVPRVRRQRPSARATPRRRTSRPPPRPTSAPTANAGGPYSFDRGHLADAQRVRHRRRQRPADLLVGRQRRRHLRRRDRREPHADRRAARRPRHRRRAHVVQLSACGSPTARPRRPSAATTLTVINTVPDATVSNGGPVDEGSTTTVSFSNVTDPSAGRHRRGLPVRLRLRQRRHLRGRRLDLRGRHHLDQRHGARRPSSPTARPPARSGWLVVRQGRRRRTSTRPRSRSTTSRRPPRSTSGAGRRWPRPRRPRPVHATCADRRRRHARLPLRLRPGTTTAHGTSATAPTPAPRRRATMTIPAALTCATAQRRSPCTARSSTRTAASSDYTLHVTVTNVGADGTASNHTVQEGQTATVGLANPADSPADLGSLRYVYDLDNDGTDNTVGVTYANASTATTATVPANADRRRPRDAHHARPRDRQGRRVDRLHRHGHGQQRHADRTARERERRRGLDGDRRGDEPRRRRRPADRPLRLRPRRQRHRRHCRRRPTRTRRRRRPRSSRRT